jgi:uncharacterized radical SAM superfamily Fe-S cluster-containing enzyme
LTDGAVKNVYEIVKLIRENNQDDLRFHTFGIGNGVSTELIKNCAEAGNGMFYFIDKVDEIEKKVINALTTNSIPYLKIKDIEFIDKFWKKIKIPIDID